MLSAEKSDSQSEEINLLNATGNFRIFKKWTEIFEANFQKLSVPFDFEPEFPEFGRMERAQRFISSAAIVILERNLIGAEFDHVLGNHF